MENQTLTPTKAETFTSQPLDQATDQQLTELIKGNEFSLPRGKSRMRNGN